MVFLKNKKCRSRFFWKMEITRLENRIRTWFVRIHPRHPRTSFSPSSYIEKVRWKRGWFGYVQISSNFKDVSINSMKFSSKSSCLGVQIKITMKYQKVCTSDRTYFSLPQNFRIQKKKLILMFIFSPKVYATQQLVVYLRELSRQILLSYFAYVHE